MHSITHDEDNYAKLVNKKPINWRRVGIIALVVFLGIMAFLAGHIHGKAIGLVTAQKEYEPICANYRKMLADKQQTTSILPDVNTWHDIRIPEQESK